MILIDADLLAERIRTLKSRIAHPAAGFVDEDSYECGAIDALHDVLTYIDEAPKIEPLQQGMNFNFVQNGNNNKQIVNNGSVVMDFKKQKG